MKKICAILVILSILLLAGCTKTQTVIKYQCADGNIANAYAACSPASCDTTSCPELDCAVCPAKVETRTVTNTEKVYICADLREVDDKADCIPRGDNILDVRINSHTTTDIGPQNFFQVREGYEYHIFDMTIQNNGAVEFINFGFKVKDTSGYMYNDDFSSRLLLTDGILMDAKIPPGEFIRGKIIFELKKDGTLTYMTITGIDKDYKTTERRINIA